MNNHGEDIKKEQWKEHTDFLKEIKEKVKEINKKYNYKPNTESKKNLH